MTLLQGQVQLHWARSCGALIEDLAEERLNRARSSIEKVAMKEGVNGNLWYMIFFCYICKLFCVLFSMSQLRGRRLAPISGSQATTTNTL